MILPWLRGLTLPRNAPVTWGIFFINLLCYLTFSMQSMDIDRSYEAYFEDAENLKVQGLVYAQYVERHPAGYSEFHRQLSRRAMEGHDRAVTVLSSLATRDAALKNHLAGLRISGDQIAFNHWKSKFRDFLKSQEAHPGYRFGLNRENPSWMKTISYQFVHSGYMHLLMNMLLLMIFGCFLESMIGSALFAAVYLIAGIAAAFSFMTITGLSTAPLVGASGAISGLIGFFSLVFWRRKVTYFYWLLPRRGYYGFANLPAWIFFVLWTSGELASQIADVPEAGGIAHSAHLGGVAAGVLMGLVFLTWRKTAAQSILRY